MKKVVFFTLAMVLALSTFAFADIEDNNVAWKGGEIDNSVDVNSASKGSNLALQGGEIDNSKSVDINSASKGSNLALQGGEIDNRSNYKNDNSVDNRAIYVVDNAVLANVNVAGLAFQPGLEQEGKISFVKVQKAEMGGSFNHAQGVSNVNSAAGNMNNQTAYTTIGVAFVK